MDVARYRSRAPCLCCVEHFTSLVPVRALTRTELLGVDQQISARFAKCPPSDFQAMAVQLAVLAIATGATDLGEELDARELDALFDAWVVIQREHMPDTEQLGAETELQLLEGDGVLSLDATSASVAESPADFFGEAVASLSDGQLAYYLTLRAAYHRWSEEGTCRSLKLLRKKAGRSESTNRLAAERTR